jgi:lambda family phage tail tape measure protein
MGLHDLGLQEQRLENQRQTESGLKKRIAELQKLGQQYKENQDLLIQSINSEATYLKMSEEAAEVAKAQNEIYNNAIKLIGELQQQIADLTEDEKGLKEELLKQIDVIEKSIPIDQMRAETAIRNLQAIRAAQEAYTRSIEDTQRVLEKNEALTQLQEDLNLIGLYGDELERQTKVNELNRDLRQQMADLSLELLKLDGQRTRLGEENYQRERQRIVQQMLDAQELSDAKLKIYEDEVKRKLDLDNSYAAGIARAFEDIEDSLKPINVAQNAVTSAFKAMEDSIDNFVETGKFKFKDFAASVIADLTKIIAKALVLSAIKSVFSAIGFSIPGLAEGGPAKAGKPYLIGEKGPELFVPQTSGTVIPNNKLSGNNVGEVSAPITNNYITNNINAVDAKSVAQLFVENRKTLLGTVKMAERELPYMT